MVMSEGLLRNRNCRGCGVVFCVCGRCDRGPCYSSPLCRQRARRQQLRAANRRHQRTDAGRRLHRVRQRDYRLRRAEARVTDHGFPVIVLPGGTRRNRLGAVRSAVVTADGSIRFPRLRYREALVDGNARSANVRKYTFSDDR
jgi:hypothetical protein